NICSAPVEVTENEKPLLFLEKELAADSGGAGRFRGGPGQSMSVRSRAAERITIGVRLDRTEHPTIGLDGGGPGGAAAVSVNDKPVHPKTTLELMPGDVFSVRTAGGAGYGDPKARDRTSVERDVADGYVSSSAARRD